MVWTFCVLRLCHLLVDTENLLFSHIALNLNTIEATNLGDLATLLEYIISPKDFEDRMATDSTTRLIRNLVSPNAVWTSGTRMVWWMANCTVENNLSD